MHSVTVGRLEARASTVEVEQYKRILVYMGECARGSDVAASFHHFQQVAERSKKLEGGREG